MGNLLSKLSTSLMLEKVCFVKCVWQLSQETCQDTKLASWDLSEVKLMESMNYYKYIFFRNCSVDIIRTHGWCMLSRVWLFATPWTVAHQAPLSMGFLRQQYWSGLQFPSPGDLPDPGIETMPPALAGRFFTSEPPEKPLKLIRCRKRDWQKTLRAISLRKSLWYITETNMWKDTLTP